MPRLFTGTVKGWGLLLHRLWLGVHVQPRSLCLQAGKFNIIPTIISSVAAFTSVGVVSLAPLPRLRQEASQGGPPAGGGWLGSGPGKPCFCLECKA